jgi:hypothetical protein
MCGDVRKHGEWFYFTDELKEYIDALADEDKRRDLKKTNEREVVCAQ